jgi:ABC-type transport system substrate-binding protein
MFSVSEVIESDVNKAFDTRHKRRMKMKKSVMFAISMLMVLGMLLSACAPTVSQPIATPPKAEQPPVEPTKAPVEPTTPPVEPTAVPVEPTAVPVEPAAPAIAPEVNVAILGDPADLGPFVGMSLGRIAVLHTIYEYLFDFTPGEPLTPYIAKSVEKTGDKTYVVTLFENVVDSAGNPIKAADAAWSYNTAMQMGNLRPLGDIESVTATGDYTVEVVLKNEPGMGDLEKVLCEAPIVSQVSYEASADQFATKPVTSSPYVLAEYVPGSSLTFEKRADYWQKDLSQGPKYNQANVQKAVFQIIAEQAQHAVALETGSADVSGYIASTDADRFKGDAGFSLTTFQDNLTNFLGFNGSEGNVFTKKELRQAVAYAVDTTAMCEAVAPGACFTAHTIGNSNFGGYMTKWDTEPYYDFDLAKAQELLAASGHKAGDLTVKLLAQNDGRSGLMAQVIQSQLKELGITVEINQVEAPVFNQLKTDPTAWDLIIDAAAGGDFINNPWQLIYDQNRNNGTTGGFFKDDQLQGLLDAISAKDGFTPENIDAFQQYQKEQVYSYGLLSFANIVVANAGITKVVTDGRGQVVPGPSEYSADFKK